jgi:uncharacterized membrane protein YraQ (UPF0718 family)
LPEDEKGNGMLILAIVTAAALLLSMVFDRKKTLAALKKALMLFVNMIFPFATVLVVVSLVLMVLSKETIAALLGAHSGAWGFFAAALIGSVSLIPGFIAFPLASLLLKMGVAYSVIAVFITTLMMVGIVTLPLEAKYFGWKVSLLRNGLSFAAAVVIGLAVGILWSVV